ncbi:MAG TPA: CHAD domain-containing protein [Gemmataceae bacterium]|jgi:CHAD domain-containing protein|nr:CHAD domain-containing protein [Gemmataceae bacterium]
MANNGKWIAGLTLDMPVEEAARKVLKARLDVVREYLPLAVQAPHEDIEHVHQLRVGTRRADAALKIFSDCLPRKVFRSQKKHLKRVRKAAGQARDWDVFLSHLESWSPKRPKAEQSGLDFLRGLAFQQRQEAQDALREVGDESLEFQELLDSVQPPQNASDELGKLALSTLTDLMDELDQAFAGERGSYKQLHQIRICGKRVRYAMEIFADCFAPPFREKMYAAIEEMQELLGSANDSHVALERLSEIRNPLKLTCPDDWSRLRPGIEKLLQSHRQRLTAERNRFRRWRQSWKKIRKPLAGLLLTAEPASESA